MTVENYENVVIGSGEGGKYLAWHLSQSGQQVAVIERRWIGGSCPNVNCLPSKNEIWSAKVAYLSQHASTFGVAPTKPPSDMEAVQQRKRRMVQGLIATNLDHYKDSGTELVMGEAKFVAPKTLEVHLNDGGSRTLRAERIFLNLGTHASIPPIPGLAEAAPLTNIEILQLDRLPEHLIVLGGGYVGLEFAQAFRRFGSRVTILHRGSQLLTSQDADIAGFLVETFLREGIDVIPVSETLSVRGRSGSSVSLLVRTAAGEITVAGSDILVATGRVPNTTSIGLEVAGVELNEQGYIKVDDRLLTTATGIWAIGECAGSPQFTHISYDDFRVIRDNLAGIDRTMAGRLIPSCLFTDPPVSQIGLTEDEACRRGIPVRVTKLPMAAVLRTRTLDESHGFMKALLEVRGDRILGFSMIGPEAGEVMAIVQVAMLAGLPYQTLRDATFLFTVTSFLCGIAPSLQVILIARVLQGIGGGGLAPVEQAILVDAFEPAKRASAFALYTVAIVTAPAIGPVLGGYITDNYSWRWVFFINIPVGILSLILTNRFVHDPPAFMKERASVRVNGKLRVDGIGIALVGVGSAALEVLLDRGQIDDWFGSTTIRCCFVIAVVCLSAAVYWELHTPEPIINLRLLKVRNCAIANIFYFVFGVGLFASTTMIPQILQSLFGYRAIDAGLVLAPGAVVITLLAPLGAQLVQRKVIQPRILLFGAVMVVGISFLHYSRMTLDTDFQHWAFARSLQGLGYAFFFVPLSVLAYSQLSPEDNNKASSLTNFFRNWGGSFGIALVTIMSDRRASFHQSIVGANQTASTLPLQTSVKQIATYLEIHGLSHSDALYAATGRVYEQLQAQTRFLAFMDCFYILGVGTLIAAPLILLTQRFQSGPGTPSGH